MRTIQLNLFQSGRNCFPEHSPPIARSAVVSEILTDSSITSGLEISPPITWWPRQNPPHRTMSRPTNSSFPRIYLISPASTLIFLASSSNSSRFAIASRSSMLGWIRIVSRRGLDWRTYTVKLDMDSTEIPEIASPEEVEPAVRLCPETLMNSAATKLHLLTKRSYQSCP